MVRLEKLKRAVFVMGVKVPSQLDGYIIVRVTPQHTHDIQSYTATGQLHTLFPIIRLNIQFSAFS